MELIRWLDFIWNTAMQTTGGGGTNGNGTVFAIDING